MDGGAADGRGGLDDVLDGRFASRFGYVSDLDGGVAIARIRGGRRRRGVFVGECTERGSYGRLEGRVTARLGSLRA